MGERMKKRIISGITVCVVSVFLILNNYEYAKADAATLIVEGGSIGLGGLVGGGAVVGPAITILAMALAANGIDSYITEETQQAGISRTDWIQQNFFQFANGTSKTGNALCETIVNGATIAKDGVIYLGQEALNVIKQFGNWITGDTSQVFYEGDPNLLPDDAVCRLGDYELCETTSFQIYVPASGQRITVRRSDNTTFYCYRHKAIGPVSYISPNAGNIVWSNGNVNSAMTRATNSDLYIYTDYRESSYYQYTPALPINNIAASTLCNGKNYSDITKTSLKDQVPGTLSAQVCSLP